MSTGIFFIIGFIALVLMLSLFRRGNNPRKYPEVVQAIIWDVKLNRALAESFLVREKPKRFENNNWLFNKDKIGFLSESLKDQLKETFKLVEEYNKIITASNKNKDDAYRSLDLVHFKELLAQCLQELEDWMEKTTGKKELPPKYPSLSTFFLGDR